MRVGSDVPGGTGVTFSDNLAAQDWHRQRVRHIRGAPLYEVASVSGGDESLPAQLAVHTTGQMIGVTALAAGKLLVGNKPVGQATSTFLSIFDGTMPVREYVYHPWFAHAAMKAVPSATMPDRFYLARSDNSESRTPSSTT